MQGQRIFFDTFGKPAEVAQVGSYEVPPLSSGEVLVNMHSAPVNPADLNVFEGTYGNLPDLPAVPGNEGAGVVLEVGSEVSGFEKDDPVMLMQTGNLWQTHVVTTPDQLIKAPLSLDLAQLSMMKVNPPTASLLLAEREDLQAGDWVLQNAGNSAVGRCLIQIAHSLGLRTVNLVRRASLIPELEAIGADVVLVDDDDAAAKAKEITKDAPPKLACNAVGGTSALRLMDMLAPGGTHVTYGAMSRRSLKVPNSFLIFKNIELRGLWVTKWREQASREEEQAMFEALFTLAESGSLKIPVEKAFPMKTIKEALTRALEDERTGKILLDLQA